VLHRMKNVLCVLIAMMLIATGVHADGVHYIVHTSATIPIAGHPDTVIGSLPLIDDFDQRHARNNIGGFTSTFTSEIGGACYSQFNSQVVDTGSALELHYDLDDEGQYCGYFTSLEHAHIESYGAITFDVRGAEGGEYFKIELKADNNTHPKAALQIADVLDGPVTTEWQTVTIPLIQFFNLKNLDDVRELVFVFEYDWATLNDSPVQGTIYIDNIRVVSQDLPSMLPIDKCNDAFNRCSLGGEVGAFAKVADYTGVTKRFDEGEMFAKFIKNGANPYGGFYFILGGGVDEDPDGEDGFIKIERAEMKQYKGLAIKARGVSGTSRVKLELKVDMYYGSQYLPNQTIFTYVTVNNSTQTINFDNFKFYVSTFPTPIKVGNFSSRVDRVKGEVVIVFESSGEIAIDELSFYK
jgi:hypothetical protein